MKKLFKNTVLLLASAAMLMVGCEPEPELEPEVDPFEGASLEVKLVGADVNVATVSVEAEVLKVVSYVVVPESEGAAVPTAAEIFEQGTLIALEKEEATQVTLRDLQPETNYVIYFAGRISADKVWEQTKEFKFQTTAEPIIPVLTAKLVGTEATSAELKVYAENVSRIAYVVCPISEDNGVPHVQVIFATGKMVNLTQGDNSVLVKNLLPNTEYIIYIAGEIAGVEEYMEEILTVKSVKTTDFAQDVAVRDVGYRGFVVDVKVDPSIKEQNHVIKWATTSLYTYLSNGGGNGIDGQLMNTHDTAWGGINVFNESKSLYIDEQHSYLYDANGEIEDWYFEPPVPGQPQIVIMGEYRRGQSGIGWGWGYYKPMFDQNQYMMDMNNGTVQEEAAYWDGFYQNLFVQVQKPEPLPDDLLSVEIERFPDDANVKVTADESLDRVAIMIMSEAEHSIAGSLIPEEYMQWFATSLEASLAGVTMIVDPYNAELGLNGTIQTALTEYFYTVPRESKFWVDVVGMRGDCDGDGFLDGYQQVYKSIEFYLPQPTKPAPELVVTPLEATSPYSVGFNIKCPTKDADGGKIIANYEKEWLMENMSVDLILDNYGQEISSLEILKINSDEGYDIYIPSRPNEKTYLGVMITNDEGTATYSDVVVGWSGKEPADSRVESELFENLQGEWIATATVTYSTYNSEIDGYETITEENTCRVTIGDVEYPEELSEDAYAIFEKHGVNREKATMYYNEFKAAAATFNENNRDQNRILMNGFDFTGGFQPYFEYSDPYSLFISDTYNGYTSEMPIYDFGPKWYLEVAADGSVTAPFNVNYFTPMSSWYTYYNTLYESHFLAYEPTNKVPVGYVGDAEGNVVNGHFPVEVSEDGNTITVKPIVSGDLNYYPNAALYYGSGRYVMGVVVVSDIVLTRNNGSAAAPSKVARKLSAKPEMQTVQSNQRIQTPARPVSRTAIGAGVEYKMVQGPKHLTTEKERGKYWMDSHRN